MTLAPGLGVGLIGANPRRGWASSTYLPALSALDEYRLAAVATTRQETSREAAERYGAASSFDDAFALIADRSVDVVVISVKAPAHAALVERAVEAGKHVYCEWPLATTTQAAQQLHELARSAGVCHAIGLQARSSAAINFVRDLIADGYVGRVLSCTVYSPTMSGGPTRDRAHLHTVDIADATSTLHINTGHVVDAIDYAVGELASLTALVETLQNRARIIETGDEVVVTAPDQVVVGGRFASGAVFSLHAHNAARPNGLTLRASVFGTDGDLQMVSDGATGVQIGELTVLGSRRADEPLERLDIPERYYDVPRELRSQPLGNVAQALRRFARSVTEGEPFSPDFATAVRRHELLDMIHRAAIERRQIDIT